MGERPTLQDESREELAELIAQAAEHLRYLRELGIETIGEAQPLVLTRFEPGNSDELPDKPADLESSPPIEEEMKKKKAAGEAPSLFAEIAAPRVEEQYGNETLADIRRDLGECRRCKLWQTRTNIVFGEGSEQAELMFVGEAPGADEDATGRPFVGRAGQLLTRMIEAIGLKREDVYIANVLKSRPPENRTPERDEIAACSPFLFRQIAAVRPRLIVTLGNPATQALLETKTGITKLRGEFQEYPRIAGIKVLPTFHPAYLLRSPDKKREAWEDLKKVRAYLRGEISG